MCQTFYIVFHQLQLILFLNSLWIQQFGFVFVFFCPPTQHVWDSFWRSVLGRLSSTFHFQYLEDQDEALGPGPKWKTHSSRFLQSSSSSCKELPSLLFLSPSGSKETACNVSTLWIFSCRQCLWGSAWIFLSNSRWYCEIWLAFLSFSPKLKLEKKHLSQIVF